MESGLGGMSLAGNEGEDCRVVLFHVVAGAGSYVPAVGERQLSESGSAQLMFDSVDCKHVACRCIEPGQQLVNHGKVLLKSEMKVVVRTENVCECLCPVSRKVFATFGYGGIGECPLGVTHRGEEVAQVLINVGQTLGD